MEKTRFTPTKEDHVCPQCEDGAGGGWSERGEDEDGGDSRFSHSRIVKSVHGHSG